MRASTTFRTYAHNATRINLSASPSPPPLYYAAYRPRSRSKPARAAAKVCRLAMLAAVLAVAVSLLFRAAWPSPQHPQPAPPQPPYPDRPDTAPAAAHAPQPQRSSVWAVLRGISGDAAAVSSLFAARRAADGVPDDDAWARELPPAYRGRRGGDWLVAAATG